jgi:hypothetical protein
MSDQADRHSDACQVALNNWTRSNGEESGMQTRRLSATQFGAQAIYRPVLGSAPLWTVRKAIFNSEIERGAVGGGLDS